MKAKLITALILSLFSITAFGKSYGIIITFDKDAKGKLKALHQSYNTRIHYDLKKLPKQVVVSKVTGLNYNQDYLKTLCGMYLENTFIKKCELNSAVKKHQEEGLSCTDDKADSLVQIRGLGSFFKGLTDPFNGCNITDPNNLGKIYSNGGNSSMPGGFYSSDITPLWAQEYIGADLAYEYIRAQNKFEVSAGKPPLKVKDGVIDTGFHKSDISKYKVSPKAFSKLREESPKKSEKEIQGNKDHGSSVISLMVSPKFGVSPVAELSLVKEAMWGSDVIEGLELALDNGTQIINMSTSTPPETLDTLKQLNKKNIIIVTSAGNNFNDGKRQVDRIYDDYEQILVGSISPTGYVSSFSQQGKALFVLAPSDYWIQSEANGKQLSFGGNSGASPLVKGALDNVLALVPGLNTTQLKTMIEKTATEVIANETKGDYTYNNGVGLINAYKLAKVANKIKLMVSGLKGKKRASRINTLLNRADIYNFSKESESNLNKGIQLLNSKNCKQMTEGFEQIRKSFFLSHSEAARKKIVEIYDKAGKDANAEFFKSVAKDREGYINDMSRELLFKHAEHTSSGKKE